VTLLKKVLYKPSVSTLFCIPYIFSNIQHVLAARGYYQVPMIKILRENYLYINMKPVFFQKQRLGYYEIVKFAK
jgi:hypothetical protein